MLENSQLIFWIAAKNKNCELILPVDALIANDMEKGTSFSEVMIDECS